MRFSQKIIIQEDGKYLAFPSITKLKNGRFLLVYRQAADRLSEYKKVTHVDPTARIMMRFSDDEGETWGEARVLYEDEMSEQDPCINTLSDGTLILTFFRWKVVPKEKKASLGKAFGAYGRIVFDTWAAVHVGTLCLRSADNGKTWEGPFPIKDPSREGALSMRGNILETSDGTLFAALYGMRTLGGVTGCVVMRSDNKGKTWKKAGDIPGKAGVQFFEPFLYMSPDNRLYILMRTHKVGPCNKVGDYDNLHVSYSDDMGKHWVRPVRTDLYCPNPIHVRPMGDKLLCTYGQRSDPKGIEGLLVDTMRPEFSSKDAFVLRKCGKAEDLGYTFAAERKDGSAIVVYYMTDTSHKTCIGETIIEGRIVK